MSRSGASRLRRRLPRLGRRFRANWVDGEPSGSSSSTLGERKACLPADRLHRLQRELLEAFFRGPNPFLLTGGAALAGFHLGHRATKDLDLFVTLPMLDEGDRILVEAAAELGASVQRIPTLRDFRQRIVARARRRSWSISCMTHRRRGVRRSRGSVGSPSIRPRIGCAPARGGDDGGIADLPRPLVPPLGPSRSSGGMTRGRATGRGVAGFPSPRTPPTTPAAPPPAPGCGRSPAWRAAAGARRIAGRSDMRSGFRDGS